MLTAYRPLEAVFKFHEQSERWILRRYLPDVAEADGAERTRPPWSESIIAIFPDRSSKTTRPTDAGQTSPATCTVYTRTRLLTTDSIAMPVQSAMKDRDEQAPTAAHARPPARQWPRRETVRGTPPQTHNPDDPRCAA